MTQALTAEVTTRLRWKKRGRRLPSDVLLTLRCPSDISVPDKWKSQNLLTIWIFAVKPYKSLLGGQEVVTLELFLQFSWVFVPHHSPGGSFSYAIKVTHVQWKRHGAVFLCPMLPCHICVTESVHDWWPHPIFPSLSSPPCQLILPQDRPPSQWLPGWLLSSEASCPGWHELMIAAQASQPSLIHYVSQPGLHRFWHSLRGTERRCSQTTLFTPLSPPLALLQHPADGGQGRSPFAKCHHYLTLGCAVNVGLFQHRSYLTLGGCRLPYLTQLTQKAKRQYFCCPSKGSNCPEKSQRSDSTN